MELIAERSARLRCACSRVGGMPAQRRQRRSRITTRTLALPVAQALLAERNEQLAQQRDELASARLRMRNVMRTCMSCDATVP